MFKQGNYYSYDGIRDNLFNLWEIAKIAYSEVALSEAEKARNAENLV